jgi:hypothetical protein
MFESPVYRPDPKSTYNTGDRVADRLRGSRDHRGAGDWHNEMGSRAHTHDDDACPRSVRETGRSNAAALGIPCLSVRATSHISVATTGPAAFDRTDQHDSDQGCGVASSPSIGAILHAWDFRRVIDTQIPWHWYPCLMLGALCVPNASKPPSVSRMHHAWGFGNIPSASTARPDPPEHVRFGESRDTSVPSDALVCVPERFLSRPRPDPLRRASTGSGRLTMGRLTCYLSRYRSITFIRVDRHARTASLE